MSPVEVTADNLLMVWKTVYGSRLEAKVKKPALKEGGHVQVSKLKGVFTKGYQQTLGDEIFIVESVELKEGVYIYKLKDYDGERVTGVFYNEELQKVPYDPNWVYRSEKVLKRKGNGAMRQALVKWRGCAEKCNIWVLATSLHGVLCHAISNYTVKLAKPVDLKGSWEVVLMEIQYPITWNTFTKHEAKFHIKHSQYLLSYPVCFSHGYYTTIAAVVDAINRAIAGVEDYANIYLVSDNVRRKVFLKAPELDTRFTCTGKLQRVLGTVQHVKRQVDPDPTCPDINSGFYTLYVYRDIVEPQRIGDSYSPLLRWVLVKGENNTMVNMQHHKPDYVAISQKHFDIITIMIYDNQSEPVVFKYGKVVVKLHLRPRR
ncbi:hypothetical protein NDU88_002111 [Pleurodeles waltl]|uniref:Uncharacterized protein n=1 Tax=Pleurodeles waltl TaxID=8319 RepID=A0AAV7T106_PLEWA|nr:hypothetical protein NDU88_002111 [Pleurodeles waltl]